MDPNPIKCVWEKIDLKRRRVEILYRNCCNFYEFYIHFYNTKMYKIVAYFNLNYATYDYST